MPYIMVEGPKLEKEKRRALARKVAEAVASYLELPKEQMVVLVKEVPGMALANPGLEEEVAAEITIESGRMEADSGRALASELTEAAAQAYGVTKDAILVLLKGRGGAHMEDTPKVAVLGGELLDLRRKRKAYGL